MMVRSYRTAHRGPLHRGLALAAGLWLGACGARQSDSAALLNRGVPAPPCLSATDPEDAAAPGDRIAPGDQLAISFYLSPEFDQNLGVRPDGNVGLKLVGDLPAAGRTPAQFARELDQAYGRELLAPQASVRIAGSPSRRVYIEGQVARPGAIPLQPGMRVVQAVAEAGGITEDAGAADTILIRHDACGYPHGSKFNLKAALDNTDGEEDIALMPADVVVVPRSGIADVNLFIKHFIKNNVPVDPYLPIMP